MSDFTIDSCARAFERDPVSDGLDYVESQTTFEAETPDNVVDIKRRLARRIIKQHQEPSINPETFGRRTRERLASAEGEVIIDELVTLFGNHPYVENAVGKQIIPGMALGSSLSHEKMMSMFRLLSPDEEKAYFYDIDAGVKLFEDGVDTNNLTEDDERVILDLVAAHEVLYLSNLRFAYKIAKRYFAIPGILKDDILQEANIGLAKAIKKFDLSKGFRFLTYAESWIRQGIGIASANQSRTIRLPKEKHEIISKINKSIDVLAQTYRREPTREEIAEYVGVSDEELGSMLVANQLTASFNYKVGERGELELHDVVADPAAEDVDKSFEDQARTEFLDEVLKVANLDDKTLIVLGLAFNMPSLIKPDMKYLKKGQVVEYADILERVQSGEEIELQAMAKALGVNPRGFRQMKASGLAALRAAADLVQAN